MKVYVEIAKRLVEDIKLAQDHLDKLKAALEGIQPLVTFDASGGTSVPRLQFIEAIASDIQESTAPSGVDLPKTDVNGTDAPSDAGEPQRIRKRGRPRKVPTDTTSEDVAAKQGRKRRTAAAEASNEAVANDAVGEAEAESNRKPSKEKLRRTRAAASGALPTLKKGFWLQLMGKRKRTVAQIVDRAVTKLGVADATRPVLANRLSAWLYPAIKAGVLQEAGTKGRYKLYQAVSNEPDTTD